MVGEGGLALIYYICCCSTHDATCRKGSSGGIPNNQRGVTGWKEGRKGTCNIWVDWEESEMVSILGNRISIWNMLIGWYDGLNLISWDVTRNDVFYWVHLGPRTPNLRTARCGLSGASMMKLGNFCRWKLSTREELYIAVLLAPTQGCSSPTLGCTRC